MIKKLAYGGIAIAVLIAAILVVAATRPDTVRVQRAARINAPPDKIYVLLHDFRRWGAWSPWESKDPQMKRSYGGAASGTGAIYGWEGDRNVGVGRMEIVNATAPSTVTIKLDFMKPFEAHNLVNFTLEPNAGGTTVTWTMDGAQPYLAKVMGLFISMDRMVGPDFETGLANLKKASES